jgi:folate-binding protein YgfZ
MELPAELDTVLGSRDVLVVEGPDAHTYLHSQVSQDINGMATGDRRWTFVLDPTGKIDGFARITKVGDERFELDTDAGFGDVLAARLNRFKIRVKAEITAGDPIVRDADLVARVAIGWPAMGAELVPGESIPAGTGLAGIAVSFTKGCYPGQELVERMDSRAAVAPKSLRRLTVADGAVAGDPVFDGDDEVGVLTSVAGQAAIGWVKRTSDIGEPIEF